MKIINDINVGEVVQEDTASGGIKVEDLQEDQIFSLQVEGLGDCYSNDGKGTPIVLTVVDGELKLYVWSDINQQDPTHIISLEGARIENRKEYNDA